MIFLTRIQFGGGKNILNILNMLNLAIERYSSIFYFAYKFLTQTL